MSKITIQQLILNGFGKFNQTTVRLGPGLNLICGDNEAGKSTIAVFVTGMLYGIDKMRGKGARSDTHARYKPLDGSGYGGIMDLMVDDKGYRLQRNFDRNEKEVHLYRLDSGKELLLGPHELWGLLFQMSRDTYKNTLCMTQADIRISRSLTGTLRNHMANLSSGRSLKWDVGAAIQDLSGQKKRAELSELERKTRSIMERIDDLGSCEEEYGRLLMEEEVLMRKYALEEQICEEEALHLEEEGDDAPGSENYYLADYDLDKDLEDKNLEDEDLEDEDLEDEDLEDEDLEDEDLEDGDLEDGVEWQFEPIMYTALIPLLLGVAAGFAGHQFILGTLVGLAAALIYLAYLAVKGRKKINNENLSEHRSMLQLERKKNLEILALRKEGIQEKLNLKEELRLQYQSIKKQQEDITYNNRTITLAMDTLKDLAAGIHEDFGGILNDEVSEIVNRITKGRYDKVLIDEKLGIMVEYQSRYVTLDYLSVGTVEQIYLALRIAAARILDPDERMPILLDDIFGSYDKQRLIETLKFLADMKDQQILLFTCRNELKELLHEAGAAFSYLSL